MIWHLLCNLFQSSFLIEVPRAGNKWDRGQSVKSHWRSSTTLIEVTWHLYDLDMSSRTCDSTWNLHISVCYTLNLNTAKTIMLEKLTISLLFNFIGPAGWRSYYICCFFTKKLSKTQHLSLLLFLILFGCKKIWFTTLPISSTAFTAERPKK